MKTSTRAAIETIIADGYSRNDAEGLFFTLTEFVAADPRCGVDRAANTLTTFGFSDIVASNLVRAAMIELDRHDRCSQEYIDGVIAALKTVALSDDLNPEFIFSTTFTDLLLQAVNGDIDLNELARKELSGRSIEVER